MQVTGVILAGGQGTRMGGKDKGLLTLNGDYLVNHVARGLSSCESLIINANRSISQYEDQGYTVVKDLDIADVGPSAGPLLGILTALETCTTPWVLISPCDTPNLPHNYFQRMTQVASEKMKFAVVAHDGHRQQNLHLLLNTNLADNLKMFLLAGKRKTYQWLDSIGVVDADFSGTPQAFYNLNTPQDMEELAG
jgi:molybdopterin-guanine dinucleotide biosynthesis protein A